jgi:hypothetical protein
MNRSGNILISALEPLTDDEFCASGVNGISAAWTVGHLACVGDLFSSWLADKELRIPRQTHDIFNPFTIADRGVCKADLVDRSVYPKARILAMFRLSQFRILELLNNFDVALWDCPPPESCPDSLPTYGAIWESLGVHTFWHLGELAGCLPRFHGTHTLNTVLHYFYAPPGSDLDL